MGPEEMKRIKLTNKSPAKAATAARDPTAIPALSPGLRLAEFWPDEGMVQAAVLAELTETK